MRTATRWLGLGSAVAACALAGLLLGGYFAALGLCPLDRAAGAVEPSTLTLQPLLPQAYPTRFGVQLPQVQRGETPSPTPSGSPSATPVTGTSTITPTPGPVDPFERIIVDPGSIYYEIGGVQYRPTPAPTSLAGPTGCGAGFACLVDGDLSTVWVPTSNADLSGWLYVPLGGPNYASDVDSLSRVTIWPQVTQPPATPAAVAPFRYEVWVQANDAQPVHLCTLQGWTPLAAMTCVPEQPVAHAAWVIIGILPPVDWHSRLAEIQIDMARRPPAPRTPTPSTPTGSATPTVTRTGTPPTATATGTPTPGALDTLEPIVGNATTMYYRAGGTDCRRTPPSGTRSGRKRAGARR